ncbi:hypothetical protein ACHAXR_001617 [Thalassiosira sp. AJA248-18]
MSPTISDDDARPPAYAPSAPPMDDGMDEEIPVVKATAVPMSSAASVPLAMSTSVPPPATAPNASVPAGMVAKSVTTTYADGRQVTVTEYQQPGASSSTGANPAAAAASSATAAIVAPRRNLGARPVNIACPYCNQTAKTRINHNFVKMLSTTAVIVDDWSENQGPNAAHNIVHQLNSLGHVVH